MLSCWRVNPESRPLFDELEKSISNLLNTNIVDHYVKLNEPYLKANVENYERGNKDYIAQMGMPNVQAPSAPALEWNEIVEIHQQPDESSTIPNGTFSDEQSNCCQTEL